MVFSMVNKEHYGLSLKEQATFLWAICRCSGYHDACPALAMGDLGGCPFKDMACEIIPRWGWLDILKNRIPPETNR